MDTAEGSPVPPHSGGCAAHMPLPSNLLQSTFFICGFAEDLVDSLSNARVTEIWKETAYSFPLNHDPKRF